MTEFPDNTIEWLIYGAEDCINCSNTKKALDCLEFKYTYIDIGKKENGDFARFFDFFWSNNIINKEHKTIPVIFNYGKFIGGYTQLCKLLIEKENNDF